MFVRAVGLIGLSVMAVTIGAAPARAASPSGRVQSTAAHVVWRHLSRVPPTQREALGHLLAAAIDGALPCGTLVRDSRPQPAAVWVPANLSSSIQVTRR